MNPLVKIITSITILFATAFAQAHASGFQTLDGKATTPESYIKSGNWSVVMMWAHDCHVCNQEVEQYSHFHDTNEGKNIDVLGISVDGLQDIKQAQDFVERHDVPFPNLTGDSRSVMQWFQQQTGSRFKGTPTLLVYGPDGRLRAMQAGAVPTEIIEKFIAKNS